MNNCPTIKEVTMPGCYSGVLKVNTGLEPGTLLNWKIAREGGIYAARGVDIVDADGNLSIVTATITFFNTYILAFKDINLEDINIKGYDQYRLLPEKNTNEVVDVII